MSAHRLKMGVVVMAALTFAGCAAPGSKLSPAERAQGDALSSCLYANTSPGMLNQLRNAIGQRGPSGLTPRLRPFIAELIEVSRQHCGYELKREGRDPVGNYAVSEYVKRIRTDI